MLQSTALSAVKRPRCLKALCSSASSDINVLLTRCASNTTWTCRLSQVHVRRATRVLRAPDQTQAGFTRRPTQVCRRPCRLNTFENSQHTCATQQRLAFANHCELFALSTDTQQILHLHARATQRSLAFANYAELIALPTDLRVVDPHAADAAPTHARDEAEPGLRQGLRAFRSARAPRLSYADRAPLLSCAISSA